MTNIEELTGPINQRLGDLGIEKTSAILSEGYCPLCSGKSSSIPVVEADNDDLSERVAAAVVNCQRCRIRWRYGPNPEGGEWVEHTIQVNDRAQLTTTLNPPPEPEEEQDEWELDT